MLNPTLSLTQPKSLSRSLLFPLSPSTSAQWSPSVTTHHKAPHNRSKPARLISTYTANCTQKSRYTDLRVAAPTEVTVKATVTVQKSITGMFAEPLGIYERGLDTLTDLFGRSSLRLELVSAEINPKTGKQWDHIAADARHKDDKHFDNEITYEAVFKKVPVGFGEVGAIIVENVQQQEMFIKNIVLVTGNDEESKITFACDSWIQSKFDKPGEKRIFFSVKSYLPSQTPKSLEDLRRKDLESLRGDGTGERKHYDRIYDYDVYNDLGDPDKPRPVLGGSKQFPYPRRCRTGGPSMKKDPHSEQRKGDIYIPRDESFSELKEGTFQIKTLRSIIKFIVPTIKSTLGLRDEAIESNKSKRFPYFTAIETLYDEGVKLPPQEGSSFFRTLVPRIIKGVKDTTEMVVLFETPELIDRDKFAWFRDEEFSRQCLAGLNPYSIKLLTELPIVSKLDPAIYGPPESLESLITPELIEREIKGVMTAKEAIKQKKLFILDYHDLLLPYVHKVRELDNRTLYGSRTVFFLTHDGTLMPIAIELTRPASPTKPQWRQVFTDEWDATSSWLWKLAKIHVCSHDTGYHQLVSHWLRTHCCIEPYIIATHRQLSAMHPIYRLLHPHFRYTMEINALARGQLINADGIIEQCFSPGKYSIELSSVAYGLEWRFDMEALPADLIRRGMAVEDPNAEYGLKLTIEDYPFANDGLLIWTSLKQWVTDYVNHYYKTPNDVLQDSEIQEWWLEIRTKGHVDKKDEPWWPKLENQDDLIQILTTIMWVTSGHHAAVNFGQYHYAGYFPNRPTIARTNMPVEDDDLNSESFKKFFSKPEDALMDCFPAQEEATLVMAILDVLSTHSPDEEYIGDKPEPAWNSDPVINAAFERFNGRMHEIEGKIDARNLDISLKNRCGAGIVPYELLKPFSDPGVTGKGIPNSISI